MTIITLGMTTTAMYTLDICHAYDNITGFITDVNGFFSFPSTSNGSNTSKPHHEACRRNIPALGISRNPPGKSRSPGPSKK
jgi:hypothetical protein